MLQHQPMYQMPMYQQKPQTGFVVVGTEEEALRYPIAPGNSITFKVENQPVILEKIMGFSQLDSPQVRRYRIVEEEPPKEENKDVSRLDERMSEIEHEIERIKTVLIKKPVRKKEAEDE